MNRYWIGAVLALPTLSLAHGVPENCLAPMAHFMELSAIPQLLHIPADGPKIMGIVPTGNSHAQQIGGDLYRIDCTVSVAWDDGHVDKDYHFSAWEKQGGGYGGSYGPSREVPAAVSPNARMADASASVGKSTKLDDWVRQAADNEAIGRGIKRFAIKQDDFGYQITIDYDPDYFTGDWTGREQAFATVDTYHLAGSFAKLLARNGIDPSDPSRPLTIHVCARLGGFTSVTGKPQFANLGCSEYDPSTDMVSRNDRGG